MQATCSLLSNFSKQNSKKWYKLSISLTLLVLEAYVVDEKVNYKNGHFNTYFIQPMARESELILKLINRDEIQLLELG